MKNFAKQMFFALTTTLLASSAFAQEAAGAAHTGDHGLIALGAGLAIGVAAFGGALGQAKAAAAALDGIARNPQAQSKIFTPMIIALALIESLVIYARVVAFALSGKI
jgi:F-type H+-transporting ATPase subunit c